MDSRVLLLALVLFVHLDGVLSCFSLGCLGGCGFGCGRYCSAKARGAKTLGGKSSLSLRTPDDAFRSCCADLQLPPACMAKCSYSTYSRQNLQGMFFGIDACPLAAAGEIHFCAAQGDDHRRCCVNSGVTTTVAGGKCLVFCDQTPGNVTRLDFSYLPCYERFESMKSCFWQSAISRTGKTLEELSPHVMKDEDYL